RPAQNVAYPAHLVERDLGLIADLVEALQDRGDYIDRKPLDLVLSPAALSEHRPVLHRDHAVVATLDELGQFGAIARIDAGDLQRLLQDPDPLRDPVQLLGLVLVERIVRRRNEAPGRRRRQHGPGAWEEVPELHRRGRAAKDGLHAAPRGDVEHFAVALVPDLEDAGAGALVLQALVRLVAVWAHVHGDLSGLAFVKAPFAQPRLELGPALVEPAADPPDLAPGAADAVQEVRPRHVIGLHVLVGQRL